MRPKSTSSRKDTVNHSSYKHHIAVHLSSSTYRPLLLPLLTPLLLSLLLHPLRPSPAIHSFSRHNLLGDHGTQTEVESKEKQVPIAVIHDIFQAFKQRCPEKSFLRIQEVCGDRTSGLYPIW